MAIKFVSRNSIGSYYNSAGLVTLAGVNEARYNYDPTNLAAGSSLLVEEQRTNLLTYSENFNNSVWVRFGTCTVSPNTTTAPDGTLTADAISIPSSSGIYQQQSSVTTGIVTASIWLKGSVAGSTIKLISNTNLSDPINQTVTLSTSWQRVAVTRTLSAGTTLNNLQLDTLSAGTVYAWGAQLEQGAFATSYIPSADTFTSRASTGTFIGSNGLIQSAATNVVRYNYNPVNLALSPKLLLEPAATNLLTYSEQFDNAAWTKYNSAITANATTAPDGTLTADKLVENNTTNIHHVYTGTTITSAAITFSVYVKAAERTEFNINSYEGITPSNPFISKFNLSTLTATKQNASTADATITAVGNGWYRCSVTTITAPLVATSFYIVLSNGSTTNYAGDGTSGIYIWGAQLETGNTATSYIPTISTQVTRAVDVSSSAIRTRAADITYGIPDYLLPISNKITIDSSKTVVFSDMAAQFGDGYEQVAAKGINNVRENWSIEWGGLTTTEKDTIVAVLNSVGSWGLLLWTPCGETTQKKYRMTRDGYSVKREGSNAIFTVSCTLRQVFDLT
jgi:phage-related protein